MPKRDKERRSGENDKMNIFMICSAARYFAGDEIEKNEMGRACSACEGGRGVYRVSVGKRGGKTSLVRP